MSPLPTDRIVVPIASTTDAVETIDSLKQRLNQSGDSVLEVVLVHVIVKGGGGIDKAPMEARQEMADDIFDTANEAFAGTNVQITDALVYDTDLISGIVTAAADHDADAIVFRPRKSGRLVRLLTGDRPGQLIRESSVPVLVLPTDADA